MAGAVRMKDAQLRSDPSRLGTVEDVDGSTITVKILEDAPSGLLFVNGEGYRIGQVGGFVRVPSGYVNLYGVISQVGAGAAPGTRELLPTLGNRWLRVELVGEGRRGTRFERGISQFPSIGDPVHVVTETDLRTVYAPGDDDAYVAIGRVAGAGAIPAYLDINRLVSRHSAVLGSTGAGKSTAVASLLTSLSDPARFRAARVVLLDLHGEYTKAFGSRARVFRIGANPDAGERELHVPYWALSFDEFVLFSTGSVTGPALAGLQDRVLAAKRASRPGGRNHGLPITDITVDTPLPFSVCQLWHDLFSFHYATHIVSSNQNQDETTRAYVMEGTPPQKVVGDADRLIRPRFLPVDQSAGAAPKVYRGSEAPRTHVDVLEGRLRDPRMDFLFRPGDWTATKDGSTPKDLDELLAAWVGSDVPISVFDLSAVPFAVVDDLVGAMLRILYDAMFWGRLKAEGGRLRPLLLVLEEAHVYLGAQTKGRAASATRRIAKEGRKYGVGLMLVSQRPSEIDGTILSQCGTMAAMRLTNEQDRNNVTSCASDGLKGLFSMLPVLRTGEALIVGEAVSMPIRALVDLPPEGRRPESDDALVVVPKDAGGERKRPGGWTEVVEKEEYAALVQAWRQQDPHASAQSTITAAPSTKE